MHNSSARSFLFVPFLFVCALLFLMVLYFLVLLLITELSGSKDGDVCIVEVKKMEICHWSKRLHLGSNITALEFCPSERYGATFIFIHSFCINKKHNWHVGHFFCLSGFSFLIVNLVDEIYMSKDVCIFLWEKKNAISQK